MCVSFRFKDTGSHRLPRAIAKQARTDRIRNSIALIHAMAQSGLEERVGLLEAAAREWKARVCRQEQEIKHLKELIDHITPGGCRCQAGASAEAEPQGPQPPPPPPATAITNGGPQPSPPPPGMACTSHTTFGILSKSPSDLAATDDIFKFTQRLDSLFYLDGDPNVWLHDWLAYQEETAFSLSISHTKANRLINATCRACKLQVRIPLPHRAMEDSDRYKLLKFFSVTAAEQFFPAQVGGETSPSRGSCPPDPMATRYTGNQAY
jgi:hypothetical protein